MTLDELEDALGAEEPDYDRLAHIYASNAIPFLRRLVTSERLGMAVKAVYLAGWLGDAASLRVAARQPSDYVRLAAVAAAVDLKPSDAAEILQKLSEDQDWRVNAVAKRYVARHANVRRLLPRVARRRSDRSPETRREPRKR